MKKHLFDSNTAIMVKVVENKVVDLDILPGTKEDQLKAQAEQLKYVHGLIYPSNNLSFCLSFFLINLLRKC